MHRIYGAVVSPHSSAHPTRSSYTTWAFEFEPVVSIAASINCALYTLRLTTFPDSHIVIHIEHRTPVSSTPHNHGVERASSVVGREDGAWQHDGTQQ
jgi:hypothetical protein